MNIYSIILIVYFIAMLLIGFASSRLTKSSDDFFIAGRKLGLLPITGTFVATFVSASTMMGIVGAGYTYGWSYIWTLLGTVLSFFLLVTFLAGPLQRTGFTTVPDLIESRYGEKARIVCSIIILFGLFVSLAAQMMGFGTVINIITGWPIKTGILIGCITMIAYTVMGGFLAVVWTDVIQAVWIVIGALITGSIMLSSFGGITNINMKMANVDPGLVSVYGPGNWLTPLLIIGHALTWGTGNVAMPHYLQRFYAAKDAKTGRLAVGISSILFVIIAIINVPIIGGGARVLFPGIQQMDMVYPIVIQGVLPPVAGGIVLSAMIAAIMSTGDSLLLAAGTTFAKDIYQRFINPKVKETELIKISQIALIVIGASALLLGLQYPTGVVWVHAFVFSIMGVALFFPVLACFYSKKITDKAIIMQMIIGPLSSLIWTALKNKKIFLPYTVQIHPILIGLTVSLIILFTVSRIENKPTINEPIQES